MQYSWVTLLNETVNVTFDKQGDMACTQNNQDPIFKDSISSTLYEKELEFFFDIIYNEYFGSTQPRTSVIIKPVPEIIPESTSISDDAPNVSLLTVNSSNDDSSQPINDTPVVTTTQTEDNQQTDDFTSHTFSSSNNGQGPVNATTTTPLAQNQDDQSSLPSNDNIPPPNAFVDSNTPSKPQPPLPHHRKWVKARKDHPSTQIIGNPSSKLRTQKATANECIFSNFLSIIELSNVLEALEDPN